MAPIPSNRQNGGIEEGLGAGLQAHRSSLGAHLHFTISNSCFLEAENLEAKKDGLGESLAPAILELG